MGLPSVVINPKREATWPRDIRSAQQTQVHTEGSFSGDWKNGSNMAAGYPKIDWKCSNRHYLHQYDERNCFEIEMHRTE